MDLQFIHYKWIYSSFVQFMLYAFLETIVAYFYMRYNFYFKGYWVLMKF